MTVKAPTSHQIAELADQRTTRFFGPPDAPSGYNSDAWTEQRRQVYENQIENARIELTRRYERDRDRETARETALKTQADEREADLRRRFDQRFPGGSDQDFAALRPALLAELSAESAAAEQDARALARARIRF